MNKGAFNFKQIKPLHPLLALFPSGHYGIEHGYRVFRLVDKVCDFQQVGDEQRQTLKICAFFLDIGRDENQLDLNQGIRTYRKLSQNKYLDKAILQTELCRFLIETQSLNIEEVDKHLDQYKIENRSETIFLFKILKDASALDAFRFGNFCAADLQFSNSRKLVLYASQFYKRNLRQDLIVREMENWLKDIQ